jgi:hypothetical protein
MTVIEQVEAALAVFQHQRGADGPGFTAKETIDGAVMVRLEGDGDAAAGGKNAWDEVQESIKRSGLAVERDDDATGPYLRVWSHLGTGAEPL